MSHFPHSRLNVSVFSSWQLSLSAPEASAAADQEGQRRLRAVGQGILRRVEDLDPPLIPPCNPERRCHTKNNSHSVLWYLPRKFFNCYFCFLHCPKEITSILQAFVLAQRKGKITDLLSPLAPDTNLASSHRGSSHRQILVNPNQTSW